MNAVQLRHGLRGRLGLLACVAVVLLLGSVGVVAGDAAGDKAITVQRNEKLFNHRMLTELLDQYTQISAAEMIDLVRGALSGGATFSPAAGSPVDAERLQRLATGSRAMNAGAILLDTAGQPLVSWSPTGELPSRDDPGWQPLYAAGSDRQTAPVSGLLRAGARQMTAVAVPASLEDGTTGTLVGLSEVGVGGLQLYITDLAASDTRRTYVVDGAGLVIAGADRLGEPFPYPALLEQARHLPGGGILETDEPGPESVVTYATGPISGWTMIAMQDRAAFLGGLEASNRRAQAALVALLIGAGIVLVVLHRRREATLHAVAVRDELTGVYNRRGWFQLAEQELARAARQATPRVLLFVDLDGLKQVNDVLGHREGDRAIRDAGGVLSAVAGSRDLVGRLGGDEFVLLLGEGADARAASGRLAEALTAHNARSGAAFDLRFSIGTETWSPDVPCGLDELVRRADAVMYAHKSGRPTRSSGVVRLPGPRIAGRVPQPQG